jgi:ferrous iron transport protein B
VNTKSNITVAIAGNPNVGKSTIFNALTGMNQHTGNWTGKTVSTAKGYCKSEKHTYEFVDIPGTYSLMAHSFEEEVARNYLCFSNPKAVIVVCDATCLERNLNLVLQTMEITKNIIVCVNLLDEAKRKRIKIDLKLLEKRLGVPVIGTVARNKKSIEKLLSVLDKLVEQAETPKGYSIKYPDIIENAIALLETALKEKSDKRLNSRWLALKLLEKDFLLSKEIKEHLGRDFFENEEIKSAINNAKNHLLENNISDDDFKDILVSEILKTSDKLLVGVIKNTNTKSISPDHKLDKILTSKAFGFPIMIILFALIFWITISGANYPSALLSEFLFYIGDCILKLLKTLAAPIWLQEILVFGVFRTLAWVVSVMLPPMAIFFPLFTLLEDSGYLPRIAYNLDKPFKKCNACGKQALTICMGFGCNAVGVSGCRIIDSPRERLLAILTNNLVPCNGRFPTIITIITMFFCIGSGIYSSLFSAIILTLVIIFGLSLTFLVTKILSLTVLKGSVSSYTLELPPYRRPQIAKVIVRSVFDRTLFVLGRAVSVAAPAGLIIWLMANISINDISVLSICANFLDPFAKLLGLDGVILIAFILGFPANEIVIPIIIMAYMQTGSLTELSSVTELYNLFIANGWTFITAISVILFSLLHWPCSTTVLTIKKETGSIKWTALAILLPTLISIVVCMLFNFVANLIV